jgi:hypothetical protein
LLAAVDLCGVLLGGGADAVEGESYAVVVVFGHVSQETMELVVEVLTIGAVNALAKPDGIADLKLEGPGRLQLLAVDRCAVHAACVLDVDLMPLFCPLVHLELELGVSAGNDWTIEEGVVSRSGEVLGLGPRRAPNVDRLIWAEDDVA